MNKITIAGHLGADPETRFTSTGKKVTTLRLAARTRRGTNEDTIWWRVTIWGEQFEKMLPHFKKGSPIIVYGEIHKPEIFNDREGKPQVALEVTAINIEFSPFGKPERSDGGSQTAGAAPFGSHSAEQSQAPNPYMGGYAAPAGAKTHQGHTFDDEVPF